MKLLINATANNSRGPLVVTESFLRELNENVNYLEENDINIHIIVSNKNLVSFNNNMMTIEYNYYSKKSLFHKYKFERFILPKFLNNNKFDGYLSIQNLGLKTKKIKQYVFIQTSLPVSDIKINEVKFFHYIKYKILMFYLFKKELHRYNLVIVQTNWMKEIILRKFKKIKEDKVKVISPPATNIYQQNKELPKNIIRKISIKNFTKAVYPTNLDLYKNNDFLISAINQYNERAKNKIILYLTLEGKDTKYIKYLGRVPFESMYTMYKEMDVLIFPSLTETVGLPLVEAQFCGLDCIVANLPYANDVCGKNAYYFDPRKKSSLVKTLETYFSEKNNKNKNKSHRDIYNGSSYLKFIEIIKDDFKK